MSGMVFLSKGFGSGSPAYNLLTGLVSTIVIVSMCLFIGFVIFEISRSIKYAKMHERARVAEADRIEREIMQQARAKRLLTLAKLERMRSGQEEESASDLAVPGAASPVLEAATPLK